MKSLFWGIILSARPRHWIKNLVIFTPVFFAGRFFDPWEFFVTSVGFGAFCLLSSSHYIFNDLLDAPVDRQHPYKRYRPIASGYLPAYTGLVVMVILGTAGFALSYMLGTRFFTIAVTFVGLHVAGSVFLRRFAVVDILTIASGYILRVYAGVAAAHQEISIWLTLALLSLALFFAIGKRCAEFVLTGVQRKQFQKEVITHYSEKLLNTYVAMFGTATFITYAYYTFLATFAKGGFLIKSNTALANVIDRKWMMVTIPFVLYGIMRYLQLVYEAKTGTLEKILTSDRPLVITGLLWAVTVFLVVYGIGR